ncbi:MAG: hypothetical protein ACT4TC_00190 [Myxococcaceae bacterium]
MSEHRDKSLKAPREVRFFRPTFVMQANPSGLCVAVRAEAPMRKGCTHPASVVDGSVTAP